MMTMLSESTAKRIINGFSNSPAEQEVEDFLFGRGRYAPRLYLVSSGADQHDGSTQEGTQASGTQEGRNS
jgi:hypothetical protein